jgi:hypothetical protein
MFIAGKNRGGRDRKMAKDRTEASKNSLFWFVAAPNPGIQGFANLIYARPAVLAANLNRHLG